ncbi:unnamed protein product [Rhizopus stolonifer]
MNFLHKRKSSKESTIDEDCLVDYDEKDVIYHDKFKLYSKCKQRFSSLPRVDYTDEGAIKRPVCTAGSRTCYLPITSGVIESILLKQHCNITKEEDIRWFKDGITWLAQQQLKETPQVTQEALQAFERACEAYFGIPLTLCEDNWASHYLLTQASKTKFLSRVLLFKKPKMLAEIIICL